MALAAPVALAQFNPVVEQQNYSKTEERQTIYTTPQYQLPLEQVSRQNLQAALAIEASDPERQLCLGHQVRPAEPAGDRDHGGLGTGGRAAVLVRGADAGEGRLRGSDLGRPGPAAVRHLRRSARHDGGVPA